jgi:hypothetical protein
MKKIYSGYLRLRPNPNDFPPYSEKDCQLFIFGMEYSLCELVKKDMEEFGKFLSVRYFLSPKEKSIYQMEEGFVKYIRGVGEAEYKPRFIFGNLYTAENLEVGDHDLIDILRNHASLYCGDYLYLEIIFRKKAAYVRPDYWKWED